MAAVASNGTSNGSLKSSLTTANGHGNSVKANAAMKSFDPTGTLESSQKYYNEVWSDTYDADMLPIGYAGPRALARVLEDVVNKLGVAHPQDLHILDVGCGAGMLGQELNPRGFTNVDGLDASPKMLEKAREKGVYGKLYEAFVNTDDKPVADIEPETYDIVAAVGAFVHAHIPAQGLRQVLKLVKRNSGLIALTNRFEPLHDGERQYMDEMAKLQQSMLREGLMEIVHDEKVEKYIDYHGWVDGRVVVLRRLK